MLCKREAKRNPQPVFRFESSSRVGSSAAFAMQAPCPRLGVCEGPGGFFRLQQRLPWMGEIDFASPQKPWNEDSPENTDIFQSGANGFRPSAAFLGFPCELRKRKLGYGGLCEGFPLENPESAGWSADRYGRPRREGPTFAHAKLLPVFSARCSRQRRRCPGNLHWNNQKPGPELALPVEEKRSHQ